MPTITLTSGNDVLDNFNNFPDPIGNDETDTIYAGAGNDSILGSGNGGAFFLDDLIYGGDGDDTISGAFGNNTVYGEAGDDFLDSRTTAPQPGIDTVYGGIGNDSIFGAQANDLIYGGAGNDTISSNFANLTPVVGRDTVYGGDGDDVISTEFRSGDDPGAPGFVEINSSVGDDVFGGAGNDTIIGATESPTPANDDDSLFGGIGNDFIDGAGGTDFIDAGAGNDTVISRDGVDTTTGGDGIDTIDFSNEAGPVVFDMASGATTFNGGDAESNTAYENAIGSNAADNIAGNDAANSIIGGGGADQLSGGLGSDTFSSGAGDDNVTGGEDGGGGDIDVLDYSDETTAGITVNYTGDEAGTAQGAGTGTDTFAEIERIIFTDQDDAVNASADNVGINLDTGLGNDFVEAGQAADTMDGNDGVDVLSYAQSAGAVTVNLETGTGTGGNADGDSFQNFESVTLSNNDDSATGSTGNDTINALGGNDTIDAGAGDDTVQAGAGNDSIDGGEGADSIEAGDGRDFIRGGAGDTIDGGGTTNNGGPGTTDDGSNDWDVLDIAGVVAGIPGATGFNVNYDPTDDENGTIDIVDGAGTILETITFSEIEQIVCFTAGTMIETPDGEVAIEDLSEGDLVMTRDHGAQPVRWIGSKSMKAKGKLAPVMIKAGALGNDRDLKVSQLHRMLVTDWRAELMFGEPEVLATAKHLVNGDSIFVAEGGEVEYFHMLFDNHEIVTANGAPSESFHPGEQGMSWLEQEVREEIFAIFPELRVQLDGYGPAARTSLKAWETRALKR